MVGVVGGDLVGRFGGAVLERTPDATGRFVHLTTIYIVAAADPGVDLDSRARRRNFRKLRKHRIQPLVKPAAGAPNLQISLARQNLYPEGKLVDRGARNELHCVGESDAETDRCNR